MAQGYRSTCPDCGAVYTWKGKKNQSEQQISLRNCRYCEGGRLQSDLIEPPPPVPPGTPLTAKMIERALKEAYLPDRPVCKVRPSCEGVGWLRWLNEDIWEQHVDPHTRRPWANEGRRLDAAEWRHVLVLIREAELICQAHNACMGFGLGMALYAQAEPQYPGLPLKAAFLVDITQDHLPVRKGEAEPRFDQAWEVFHPLTHNDANAALLKRHGLKEPMPKGHYSY